MEQFKPGRMLLVLAVLLLGGHMLSAQDTADVVSSGDQVVKHYIPYSQIFTFLFLMIGPFKIIGPFAKMTAAADAPQMRNLALRGIIFASLALLLTGLLGEKMLHNFHVSVPVMALTAGIILFHVALMGIFNQFETQQHPAEEPVPPTPGMAMTPLAFPTIVTPYGIAALIVFLALQEDVQGRFMIGGIVLLVMALNLLAMLYTRPILKTAGVLLQLLGAVIGIIQAALGLNIIITTLKLIWI